MLVRICFTLLLLVPIVLIAYDYRSIPAAKGKRTWNLTVNSGVFYAIAYNLIFLAQEIFLVMGKVYLGLSSTLYHNNHTWDGYHENAALMQGLGAAGIFVLGIIFLIAYVAFRWNTNWQLLVLWIAYHGLIQSIPQVFVAFFAPTTDVGQAFGWLRLSEGTIVLLAVCAIILAPIFSWVFCKLMTQYTDDTTTPGGLRNHIVNIAVLGAGLGTLFILPFRILPLSQIVGPIVLFVFFVPWLWALSTRIAPMRKVSHDLDSGIRVLPITILVLLLGIFQLILAPGLTF